MQHHLDYIFSILFILVWYVAVAFITVTVLAGVMLFSIIDIISLGVKNA